MKSERLYLRIDSYKKEQLKEIADKNNLTISKLIMSLIDLVIEENSTK